MIIKPTDKRIRFSERWQITDASAVCTAPGNYFEFIFSGDMAVMEFNTDNCRDPYPHLYIKVDDGARIESPIDKYLRITTIPGTHRVEVILKSAVEAHHRWYAPLVAKAELVGIAADAFGELTPDNRKTIEFIGDSITEGVLINPEKEKFKDVRDRVFQDDSTATYAWLTAEALNLRPIIMGYGAVGTTRSGSGAVPKVAESYPFYSFQNPMPSANADYIVINHGTNDASAAPELVDKEYSAFLELVRERNPHSKIIALTPFGGFHAELIEKVVENHNKKHNDSVYYINSTGWVPREPIHPERDGHKIVSEHLVEELRKIL